MQKVGIDTASFYTSHYYLDLKTLAQARGIDVDKFYIGMGQRKMAVTPPDEDIISMAANAAHYATVDTDLNNIDYLLFATETGVDQSKAAGIFLYKLLKLPASCRIIEIKQACYSATCGLQLALNYLKLNPTKKVLLIASDVASYGLNTSGESSQGAGAVAMVLSANPRLLVIENESGIHTEDAMDFWRPNYRDYPIVDGKFSCNLYLKVLKECWRKYNQLSRRNLADHDYFCYHTPLPKLAEKAHQKLLHVNGLKKTLPEEMEQQMGNALKYNRIIGNCYTASLYLSLISLLENTKEDCSHHRIGFYSYGSGCVGEFFSGVVQPTYREVLPTEHHQFLLARRTELSEQEYETFYQFELPTDGSSLKLPKHRTGLYRFAEINQHKRIYEKVHNK